MPTQPSPRTVQATPAAPLQTPAPKPQAAQPAAAAVPPDPAGPVPNVDPAGAVNLGRHIGGGGVAKIAAQLTNNAAPSAPASRGADKKILSSYGKQVTEQDDSVGIAVAKVDPVMPSSTLTERQPSALVAAVPASAVAPSSNPAPGDAQQAAPQGVAQRAVEAALSAAEVFNSGGHQAVNLQFSVGNADLSLRVELKNGEIHTTFRTDSADLRSDLAKEWQSAGPTSGSLRLAEPVFTSSGAPASAAGDSASQQRGGQGRADTAQTAPRAANTTTQASTSQVASTARMPSALSTSLHLQAFA